MGDSYRGRGFNLPHSIRNSTGSSCSPAQFVDGFSGSAKPICNGCDHWGYGRSSACHRTENSLRSRANFCTSNLSRPGAFASPWSQRGHKCLSPSVCDRVEQLEIPIDFPKSDSLRTTGSRAYISNLGESCNGRNWKKLPGHYSGNQRTSYLRPKCCNRQNHAIAKAQGPQGHGHCFAAFLQDGMAGLNSSDRRRRTR